MKYLFLVNPAAGKANAAVKMIPAIRAASQELRIPCEIIVTTHKGHAAERTAQCAALGEPARIFTCGGDGTLNEVVQQAVGKTELSVGCVPCGSGNDFVRNFAEPEAFRNLCAQLKGRQETIDVIRTSVGYSAAICAAGLDAQVAYGIPKYRRLPFCGGTAAYTLSIIETFFHRLGNDLEITVDGQDYSGNYMMTAICNGRLYGGGYLAAPHAAMKDGLLDIVLVHPIPRVKIPGFLSLYKAGKHLSPAGKVIPALQPYMTFLRAKSISIRVRSEQDLIVTADGECSPQRTLTAEIRPRALNILIPEGLQIDPEIFRDSEV
jgi:YegS/Rv2252/BmrU family lipid kinase